MPSALDAEQFGTTEQPDGYAPDGVDNPRVLVVLTNYKRTDNLGLVVGAIRSQSHQCRVVIVDNHPEEEHRYEIPPVIADLVDDVWRIGENAGPPCRFAPALALHDCRYVYFHDEDMLPGHRAIAWFLEQAVALRDQFATLGQVGRRFGYADKFGTGRRKKCAALRWRYAPVDVSRSPDRLTAVDMTACAHFVRADLVRHAINLKWDILSEDGLSAEYLLGIHRHDDLLLCQGIQRATGLPSYLTPIGPPETSIRRHELPQEPPASSRPSHKVERTRFVRRMISMGWEPLWPGLKSKPEPEPEPACEAENEPEEPPVEVQVVEPKPAGEPTT